MRALKILVYGMGVILVVGVIVLVVAIAYRLKHPGVEAASAARAVLPTNGLPRTVALPAGAKVIAVQNDGDRVMVRLGLGDGGEELMLLDWKSGATIGIITLK